MPSAADTTLLTASTSGTPTSRCQSKHMVLVATSGDARLQHRTGHPVRAAPDDLLTILPDVAQPHLSVAEIQDHE
jgi:hypothetical protein